MLQFTNRRSQHQGLLILLLLPALLLLQACSKAKLEYIPETGVIIAFGDSLTTGVGTQAEYSYPSVLAELSGREVLNAGVSGEVTADGLVRLRSLLEETTANLLILIEGGNDILRNQDLNQSKRNLAQMIELTQSHGMDVVLVGVPEKRLFSSSAPMYGELAEEYNLVFDGEIIGSLIRQTKYKSDSVYFNREGYRIMAEGIYELLEEHGAL